jgi:hypothetical protein
MSNIRKIVLMGGIVTFALGAGLFLLQGQSRASAQPERLSSAFLDPVAPIPDSGPGPAARAILATRLSNMGAPDVLRVATPLPTVAAGEETCGLTATATPSDMATVLVTVVAPCLGSDRVVLHHEGLEFSEVLDTSGKLTVRVPVLNENVVILVRTRSKHGGIAVARVPSLALYDRFVLQWTGADELRLLSQGNEDDARNYLWSASALAYSAATNQTPVAAVIPLGNPAGSAAKMASVYTVLSEQATRSKSMGLIVEAEVTADNCGRDISARSLDLRRNSRLRMRDIVLSMPDCSAVGERLVLGDLTEDPVVASR